MFPRSNLGQVLGQLPEKTRERVALTMTDDQKELIQKGVDHLVNVEQNEHVDPITKKAAFMSLWRDIGKIKVPCVIEYINDVLESEEKFVVFAHHQFVMDEIDTFLTKKGVRFMRIDGKTMPQHRTRMVDEFQTDASVRVALLSITAAGVGLTLTSARLVLFAELYFTPGSMAQCEDRCHRIGQNLPVSVRYLLAEGTADEKIWYILARKMQVLGEMLGQKDSQLSAERSTYDEEIKQTDMEEFMCAIRGTARKIIDSSINETNTTTVKVVEKTISLQTSSEKARPKKRAKAAPVNTALFSWTGPTYDTKPKQ